MAGVWDAAPSEMEMLVQTDKLAGGSDALLVIDDTAVQGKHSVGVQLRRLARTATPRKAGALPHHAATALRITWQACAACPSCACSPPAPGRSARSALASL
jgi:hypothetical protein